LLLLLQVRKSVKAFTDTLLDLTVDTPETRSNVVDLLGRQELLYLGPDEQVTLMSVTAVTIETDFTTTARITATAAIGALLEQACEATAVTLITNNPTKTLTTLTTTVATGGASRH
jgi:hypothetical protein